MVDAVVAQERRDFYVYVIFRTTGEPCYVGKGTGGRWKDHVRKSHNPHLKSIYALAGGDLPILKIREELTNEDAIETEIALIAAIGRKTAGSGPLVNMTDGGDGRLGGSPSIETRAKLSVSRKGTPLTPRALASLALGRALPRSPENLEKLRSANVGRVFTPEARAKISAANKGRTHTPETRAKVAAAGVGRIFTPERRSNIAAALKGRPLTPEHKAKLSVVHKGCLPSDETRAKMKAAWVIRRAAKSKA